MTEPSRMSPISDTAFFCCGIRELDAESQYPICNDVYAKNFMTEQGRKAFKKYNPGYLARGLNYVRPKIIDDYVTERLKINPKLKIILIGAGFDSRAYRLAGGDWIEIDDAAVIDHKNYHLPIECCPNPLKRIPIDFSKDNMADILNKSVGTQEHLYIVEGVFMYLEVAEIKSLLNAIKMTSSSHTLICDLMTHSFINKFAKPSKKLFDDSGAVIKCQTDQPESLFLERGYSLIKEQSIALSAIKYGAINIPQFLVLRAMRRGFRVMLFELVYK